MGLGATLTETTGGERALDVVSTFCLVMEALSEESRSWRDDGREDGRELELRLNESIVELLRTALFKRPAHLGFGLPLLMSEREDGWFSQGA